MADVATLGVKISVDSQNAINDLNDFHAKLQDIGKKMAITGGIMTAAITTPLVLIGKQMFGAASDFDESLNKVNVAFGDSASNIVDWSKTTIKQFGIAQGTALDMASLFGDMSTAMGLSTSEAANMSTGLVGLAGDLASFKNVQLDVAKTALAGIFTGETESLKRLGIVMTEANLTQYALSKGMTTAYNDMTQAEKVQLRYAYVTEMSKNSVGDFARTSDSAANQSRTLNESLKEASTQFGQVLLPLLVPVIKALTDLVTWFGSLDSNVKLVIIVLGGLLAIAGPLLTLLGSILMVVGAMTPAMVAMILPIAGVVAAITALIVVGVLLWKNWDIIVEKAGEIWIKVKDAFVKMWEAIKEVFFSFIKGGLLGLVNDYIMKPFFDIDLFEVGKNVLMGLWNGISSYISTLYSNIKNALTGLVDKAKNALGIHSPSTIFMGIGENISLGLAKGITSSLDVVANATVGMANVPINTYEGSNRSTGVNQTIVINAPTELNPMEVARQTNKLARQLAVGLY